MSVMESGHLLTRSGLTYLEVSSEVCHEAFCLHAVSSSSCIPAVYLEPVLFLIPLQCVNLFRHLSQVYPVVLLIYFISVAVILLASLALQSMFNCHITRPEGPVYYIVLILFPLGFFCGLNTLFIIKYNKIEIST